jgi:hypothetical protein
MKLEFDQKLKEFRPLTLTITLETKDELEALYRISDYGGLIEDVFPDKPIKDILHPIYKGLKYFCFEQGIDTQTKHVLNK